MGFLEAGAEAKVRELHMTSGIQQQVVRLDISATFFYSYSVMVSSDHGLINYIGTKAKCHVKQIDL